MLENLDSDQLITATGGTSFTNGVRPQPPTHINVQPPVWPRKVDGRRAVPHTGSPHVGF